MTLKITLYMIKTHLCITKSYVCASQQCVCKSCVSKSNLCVFQYTHRVLKSQKWAWNQHVACKNHTCTSQCHTQRVEITFMSVAITLYVSLGIKNTLVLAKYVLFKSTIYVSKTHTLRVKFTLSRVFLKMCVFKWKIEKKIHKLESTAVHVSLIFETCKRVNFTCRFNTHITILKFWTLKIIFTNIL
jgi:hypothetical protein